MPLFRNTAGKEACQGQEASQGQEAPAPTVWKPPPPRAQAEAVLVCGGHPV